MDKQVTEQAAKRAVVFAYHDVGVRCLKVLLARGVKVELVISHQDNPQETIWFASVRDLCAEYGLPCITPERGDSPEIAQQISRIAPDFIFSFYYRHMLPASTLALAREGAFNMHGSLLPKYRGRVPVNWAVLHGETETGMSLHEMSAKPDAGDIIAQTSVPILTDDTAYEVFGKLTVAAEQTLWQVLPAMLTGNTPRRPNRLAEGSYFGGRTPEQGRIDWEQSAQQVYNLHRAVAPPYPGAFTEIGGKRFIIKRARLLKPSADTAQEAQLCRHLPPGLAVQNHTIYGVCRANGQEQADGMLIIHELLCDGQSVSPAQLQTWLAAHPQGPQN